MKILLLNPPAFDNSKYTREGRCTQKSDFWATVWPPITLAYIGAVLERLGHEVKIIDCAAEGISVEGTLASVRSFEPSLAIWSSATPSIAGDLKLAGLVKGVSADIATAIFGVHASVFPRECLNGCNDLDFIICGEPEITAGALASALGGKTPPAEVEGIACRLQDGTIAVNKARPPIADLDTLPFPAWHLVRRDRYRLPLKGRRFLLVLPSRGCPYSCTFCTAQNYYGKKVRLRSAGNVVDEIEQNAERYGIRDLFFWSETFTFDKRYVSELCDEMARRKLRISWTCNSRVDVVDGAVLKKMASAGCWMVSFGIESGCQEILDAAKKGAKVGQAAQAVRLAKDAGLSVVGHFILGLPGETAETLERTIRFSRSLGLDFAQYYCAVPFPGSELYETALKEGWMPGDDFGRFGQDAPVLNLPTIECRTVGDAAQRAYREFYYHPGRALGVLRHVNYLSARNLAGIAGQAFRFIASKRAK